MSSTLALDWADCCSPLTLRNRRKVPGPLLLRSQALGRGETTQKARTPNKTEFEVPATQELKMARAQKPNS